MTTATPQKHDEKIVNATGEKLTTTCSEGKTHHYTLDKDTKVSCDGKTCKTADLKAGSAVKVTTHKDDKNVATHVECSKATPATAKKA